LFDACREISNLKAPRDYVTEFGGEHVRIYSTPAGARVLHEGFETDAEGKIIEQAVKYEGENTFYRGGGSLGSKITSKFAKHARDYGFPEFPQGFSFWAWLTDVKQYQVDVKQNCTKTVHFATPFLDMVEVRAYQRRYLLSEKKVIALMDSFHNMDNITHTDSLTLEELYYDLTVFGLNWPPYPDHKDFLDPYMPPVNFADEMKKLFASVQMDDDGKYVSIDEFFLLFIRIQPRRELLNKLLADKNINERPKDNYIFKNKKNEYILKFCGYPSSK